MSVRGIVRDIISLYLGYEIIRGWITGTYAYNNILTTGIVLFALAVWFLLERIGVLPKL